jgi:hypothetical protein
MAIEISDAITTFYRRLMFYQFALGQPLCSGAKGRSAICIYAQAGLLENRFNYAINSWYQKITCRVLK